MLAQFVETEHGFATNCTIRVDEMAFQVAHEGDPLTDPKRIHVLGLTSGVWIAFAVAAAASDAMDAPLGTATFLRAAAFAMTGIVGAALCLVFERGTRYAKNLAVPHMIAAFVAASCFAAILWTVAARLGVFPLARKAAELGLGASMRAWPYQSTTGVAFVFLAWAAGWLMLAYAESARRARTPFAEAVGDERPDDSHPATGAQGEILAFLWIPKPRGAIRLATQDVVSVTAERDYVRIRAMDGGDHLIRTTLQNLTARLDPSVFLQVHRSAVINIRHIRSVSKLAERSLAVELVNGTQVRVGRSHTETVRRLVKTVQL